MGIKLKLLPILITIVVIANIFATCKKSECISNSYQLKETWKIMPEIDSVNIGDTLKFSSIISNTPFDYNTNKLINFRGNAIIGTTLAIRYIAGGNSLIDAVDSFDYFLISGKLEDHSTNPKRLKDLYWIEKNNMYSAEFGIIPRKKGNYMVTLPDALGKLIISQNCGNGASIYLSNSNINNNAYLSKPYYSSTPSIPKEDSSHMYCIRVK